MTVKIMGKQNFDEMFQLAKYAFNTVDTPERRTRFQAIAEQSWNYGYFDEDVLTSQVMVTPFEVNLLGQTLKMAGVGLVSSYPEYRGQGGVNQIMQQVLVDLDEKEIELSYLAPFSYPFYRRYGYEYLFEKTIYQVPASLWPNVAKQPGYIRRTAYEQAKEAIQAVYHKMPKYQQGALIRDDWWFEYKFKLKENFSFAIYYNEEHQAEGYLVYQMLESRFVIAEWGYLSATAFWSLARFIGSHSSSFTEFHYETGDGNSLNYLFPTPIEQVSTKPEMMVKIVNVERFLRKLRFKEGLKEVRFSLNVTEDIYSPWNVGRYQIIISPDGNTEVLREEDDKLPELAGDIQSMTQLLMGFRSAQELVFFGKIVGDVALAKAFDSLALQQQPVLEDYF